ncbi:hypothetical protein KFU94_48590 [Chloroflexi bacterium TSY]|nr:hypothetical protein [Chloroflexi bacterium TSY]
MLLRSIRGISSGNVELAVASYRNAELLDPTLVNYDHWNELCRQGTLWGYAENVVDACDRAVDLRPTNPYVRDSRGINRALIGDIAMAIADFEYYVLETGDYEGQRREWLQRLKAREDPSRIFDSATLEALRY